MLLPEDIEELPISWVTNIKLSQVLWIFITISEPPKLLIDMDPNQLTTNKLKFLCITMDTNKFWEKKSLKDVISKKPHTMKFVTVMKLVTCVQFKPNVDGVNLPTLVYPTVLFMNVKKPWFSIKKNALIKSPKDADPLETSPLMPKNGLILN